MISLIKSIELGKFDACSNLVSPNNQWKPFMNKKSFNFHHESQNLCLRISLKFKL